MEREMMNLPLQGREATVIVAAPVAGASEQERTIEVCWTTGARVQRARWEGWDDYVEYDEELDVTSSAVRLERLNTVGTFLDSLRPAGATNLYGALDRALEFAGRGLHDKYYETGFDTLYVLTFENETREFQLTQQLTERVVNEFLNESRLRLVGDEEDADLVVLGTIKDYEEEALSYDPRQGANPDVFTRRVLLTVDVRLQDQVRDETLWENASLREWGEFNEEQGEGREEGIARAVDKIAEELLRHVVEEF